MSQKLLSVFEASILILAIGCSGPTGALGPPGQAGPDGPPAPTATNTPLPKRIFVTTTQQNGNLGGLNGADQICQTLADAVDPGSLWKAWLSDSSTNAIDRIADVGPWYRMDRTGLIFPSKASISSWPLLFISLQENGSSISNIPWTGTDPDGYNTGDNCSDWGSTAANGTIGQNSSLTGGWTEAFLNGCTAVRPLYCFEQ